MTAGKHGGMFPLKLYDILSDAEPKGFDHIISWAVHGRCFMVHKPKAFVERILPLYVFAESPLVAFFFSHSELVIDADCRYFQLSKITSFQRQLNLYGFRRLHQGPDRGSSYHECFLRGQPDLVLRMVRVKIKGTRIKPANNPDDEPNFYAMPPLLLSESKVLPATAAVQPKTGTVAFTTPSAVQASPLGSDIRPLQPTRPAPIDMSAIASSYVPNGVCKTSCSTILSMQQGDNVHLLLPNSATATEKQIKTTWNDPTLNDIVDELFFEEVVDSDMIGDFCSEWTRNIHYLSPNLTFQGNWLPSFN